MLPYINANENKTSKIIAFKGLDLRSKADSSTLSKEENISADSFPAISPRKSRKTVVEAKNITFPISPQWDGSSLTDFTGIRDNAFYYRGKKIWGLKEDIPRTLVDFNGKICVFPDKLFFDPVLADDALVRMERDITITHAQFYSRMDSVTGEYVAYIYKKDGGFTNFRTGDSVVISGCETNENNTYTMDDDYSDASNDTIISAVVNASDYDRLDLLLYNKNGGKALFKNCTDDGNITIKLSIPQMNNVCVHNNRLWGTSEDGKYIYASKLGDFLNFNSFQGLSDDSWYSMVGTPGKFTGICSYRSSVVAFKDQCIHHIYGDSPSNFSIPKQTEGGCIDGRSISELGGLLYYLSPKGFCTYNGGEPLCISPQITTQYTACVSGNDGKRYYTASYKKDGDCDVLVYDPTLNLWHREDDTPFISFFNYGLNFYGATKDCVFEFDTGDSPVEWFFETQPLTSNDSTQKGVNCLWLRADTNSDTEIEISISHDNCEFIKCSSLKKGEAFRCHRIPIRFKKCDSFKIRVEGRGKAVIHGLELFTYQGGKNYEQ
ncbi:MAG: hypothetical protein IKV89_02140 [Clostridia bacterium]|nr:hypothetical protein [Clostridia bacterium]